jgi:hypothetical protein
MMQSKNTVISIFSQQILTNALTLPERECQTIETIHVNVMYQSVVTSAAQPLRKKTTNK